MAKICDRCLEECVDCEGDIYACVCGKSFPPNVFQRIDSVDVVEIN